jgi:hypothetical protein
MSGPNFFDGPALSLRPTAPGRNDQSLTERMRMPRRTRPRLERNACSGYSRGIGSLKQRVNPDGPVNQSDGPFVEACEPLRSTSMIFSYQLLPFPDETEVVVVIGPGQIGQAIASALASMCFSPTSARRMPRQRRKFWATRGL